MHDPDVLILDEPTSGLDPVMQEVFVNYIKNEKSNGKTIFISSHIFNEIEDTCDIVSIIKDGKIVSTFDGGKIKHSKNKSYKCKFKNFEDMQSFLADLKQSPLHSRAKGKELYCSKVDKIKNQVSKKAKQIRKSLEKRKVGFKTRFFFKLFGMTQKNGWNKVDADYWKTKGWLDGKKPY